MCPMPYRYPVKCDRYQLRHPFQRWLVAKYEALVDWSAPVTSPHELDAQVRQVMFPALWARTERDAVLARLDEASVRHVVGEERWRQTAGDPDARSTLMQAALEVVQLTKLQSIGPWRSWAERYANAAPHGVCFAFLMVKAMLQAWDKRDRRPLPDPAVWALTELAAAIERDDIAPDLGLGDQYRSLIARTHASPDDWTFVPGKLEDPAAFESNVRRLQAVADGSGWCIAGAPMATVYLTTGSFHVLLVNARPQVALRVEGRTVVECQGPCNLPPYMWAGDIADRCDALGLLWVHRRDQLLPSVEQNPVEQWRTKLRAHPWAIGQVPASILRVLGAEARKASFRAVTNNHMGLARFQELWGAPSIEEWCGWVGSCPTFMRACPEEHYENPKILHAFLSSVERLRTCGRQWLEWVVFVAAHFPTHPVLASWRGAWRRTFLADPHDHRVHAAYIAMYGAPTVGEWAQMVERDPEAFVHLPAEVQGSMVCVDAALEGVLARLPRTVQYRPSAALEAYLRRSPKQFLLSQALAEAQRARVVERRPRGRWALRHVSAPAASPTEDSDAYVAHLVEMIVKLDGAGLHRLKVPPTVCAQPALLRRWVQAWNEVVQRFPTYMVVVPEVLRDQVALPQVRSRRMVSSPVMELRRRPWRLDQQRGLSKAARFHPDALPACVAGWAEIVEARPGKSYESRYGQRVDMSVSLEFHPDILAAAARGFADPNLYPRCWRALSDDRRSTAWVQVAMARMLVRRFDHGKDSGFARKVDADIWQDLLRSTHPEVDAVLREVHRFSPPGTDTHADADLTEHHTLAEVARRAPAAVICLLSALRYHQLTSQNPSEVWVTLPRDAWRPAAVGSARLRVFTASPTLYGADVEDHLVEGIHVRVYSAVRTVADCFRHRSAVGLDVALAALRDLLRRQPSCRDALWRCACRVRIGSVLRPYLEALS